MLKSRSGSPVNASVSTPPSIETVRRRARHRLIGASVLVLVGVIGFSLLFDTQPRPISVDIPIEIPTRAAVAPVQPAPVAPKAAAASPAAPQAPVRSQDVLDEREEVVNEQPAAAAPTPTPPAAATSAAKSPPGGTSRPDDGARAQALLEGRPAAGQVTAAPSEQPAAASVRLVVQVGAFADNGRAQDVRKRLERAGLKTYTHVAETSEGRRIRVRVGPFDSRQEAEKAAERVKRLNLPARILTL